VWMENQPTPSLLPVKIVVGALMMGMVTMTVVIVALVEMGMFKPQRNDVLLMAVAAMWPVLTVTAFAMGLLVKRQAREQWKGSGGDQEALLQPYATGVILQAALMEGGGLFGAIVFFLTGEQLALLAPGLSVAMLGLVFPTEGRFQGFVRDVTAG